MAEFNLEEKNFENMVFMHRGQLRRVLKGVNVYKVFSAREINKLRNDRILIYSRNKRNLVVSEKAQQIISSIKR
jgi:hypothetical protein